MTAPATPPEGLGLPLTHNTPASAVQAIYSKGDGNVYALVNGVEIQLANAGGGGNFATHFEQYLTGTAAGVAVTGVGFAPTAGIFVTMAPAGGQPFFCIGFAFGPGAPPANSQFNVGTPDGTGLGLYNFSFNHVAEVRNAAGTFAQEFDIVSFDADGFTYNRTLLGVNPGIVLQTNCFLIG